LVVVVVEEEVGVWHLKGVMGEVAVEVVWTLAEGVAVKWTQAEVLTLMSLSYSS
jgi:hypothetical protein